MNKNITQINRSPMTYTITHHSLSTFHHLSRGSVGSGYIIHATLHSGGLYSHSKGILQP